jgi:hypothetical protein
MKSPKRSRRVTRAKPVSRSKAVKRSASGKPARRDGYPKPPARRTPKTAAPPVEVPEAPLGPVVIPDAEEAQAILAELAHLNDRSVYLHTKYEGIRDKAREAKGAWEAAVKSVQEKLRLVTHPSLAELPLFDAVEREADQVRMEERRGRRRRDPD